MQTISIGYGTTAPNLQELAALKAFLSLHPQLKWAYCNTSSPFKGLPAPARIEPVLLLYTNAVLFGLLVQAPTTEEVHVREKSQSTCSKAEEPNKAVSKAILESPSALER